MNGSPASVVDLALGAALLLSMGVGVWRGFVLEMASLLGWFVAFAVARWGSPWWVQHGPVPEGSPELQQAVAFGACFVLTLITWTLLARLLRLLVHLTPLQTPDRLIGAVFGLVRGVLLLLLLAILVAHTPFNTHPAWQGATGRLWLERLHDGLRPLWQAIPLNPFRPTPA